MSTTEQQVAHVWRRLGFSATRTELDAGIAAGPVAVIDDLLSRPLVPFAATGLSPLLPNANASMSRVLELMAYGPSTPASGITDPTYNPFQERLSWMLQGLVVIGVVDSVYHADMIDHIQLLRDASTMSYKTLLQTVAVRPGMLKYLSGNTNIVGHPNQNFARELSELFSLGRVDVVSGQSNYTQADVVDMARALTGWTYNFTTGAVSFNKTNWDSGSKTFFGKNQGAAGLPEVVSAIAAHPAYATYVPARVDRELVGLVPSASTLTTLQSVWLPDGDLLGLIKAIAHLPEFLSDQAIMARTKTPVERVAAAARLLGSKTLGTDVNLPWNMTRLAQHPLIPPNVSGWPKGDQWLNATNLQLWSEVANGMANHNFIWNGTTTGPVCPTVTLVFQNATGATAGAYVTHLAGLDPVTPKSAAALDGYAKGGPWTLARAAGLLTLLLMTPEFLAN